MARLKVIAMTLAMTALRCSSNPTCAAYLTCTNPGDTECRSLSPLHGGIELAGAGRPGRRVRRKPCSAR